MKRSSFKKKYSPLKRTGSLKRSGFKQKLTKVTLTKRKSTLRNKSNSDMIKLDDIFSLYIRLKYLNVDQTCTCVTCETPHHYKEMDAGHFIPRQHMATRYDEDNVFPQCHDCNRFSAGNWDNFILFLGEEKAQELKEKARTITTNFPFKEKIDYYKDKVRVLKIEKIGIGDIKF